MSNVKKIQEIQLDILKTFIQICDKHQLRYYFIGGSLIGVLRHKGFIPWDDDIDLGMPRSDFDKFCSLQQDFPEGFSLINHENDSSWNFNLVQFVDNESKIIVRMNELPREACVWIDVFPIDGAPRNKLLRWTHLKYVMLMRYLIQLANVRTQVRTNIEGRPWYEKIVLKAAHYVPFEKIVNVETILKKMSISLKKYDFDKMPFAGNLLGRRREHECVPKSWWGSPTLRPFEDLMVSCPAASEKYLSHIYGDFMQLPPLEKRESHDVEIVKIRTIF